MTLVSLTTSVECILDRFWHIEEPDPTPLQFTELGQCESIFVDKCMRLELGIFAVPFPIRAPVRTSIFVGSRDAALKCLEGLERKLSSGHKLRLLYNNFMSDYLSSRPI